MAEIPVIKRFSFFKLFKNELKTPFCPEIRDFIAESYKCQVLFANCDGYYQRRIRMHEDRAVLDEFIYNTMYCCEFQENESLSKNAKSEHVSQISEKMILLSGQYNLDEEIHFSVVWIYYFDYKLRSRTGMPVFKIFKKTSGNEAVFLDVFLNSYESWDCYLETAEYPESFLCVPRHGEYCFDTESGLLRLEFLRSGGLKTNKNNSVYGALPKVLFSEVSICLLIANIKILTDEKKKQIMRLVYTLCSYWNEYKDSILNVVLFAFWLAIKVKVDPSLSPFTWKWIHKQAYMLLNMGIETEAYQNLLQLISCSDLTKTFIKPNFLKNLEIAMQIFNKGNHFFELLNSQQKDWIEILNLFCVLFKDIEQNQLFCNNIVEHC